LNGLCLDKGYDYDEVYAILRAFGFTAHVRPRGEEVQAIKREAGFKACRWVVERVHSWLNRFRRLLVRWEKKPQNYLALLHFACGLIAFSGRRVIRIGFKDGFMPCSFPQMYKVELSGALPDQSTGRGYYYYDFGGKGGWCG
jgi:transposase